MATKAELLERVTASGHRWLPAYCGCGTAIPVLLMADGRLRWPLLHCPVCHESGHVACLACDACLGRGRSDRRYCNSTCRMRALRRRGRQG